MLRKDTTARLVPNNYMTSTCWVSSGRKTTVHSVGRFYGNIMTTQETTPVMIAKVDKKTWWIFQGDIYWEDEGYTEEEIQVLILASKSKREQKIQRAKASLMQGEAASSSGRMAIPDEVKMQVWQRDKGRCVKCGSNKNLEYDHIIPLSMGGSNTVRNIQLLCQNCNRSKGASLA